MDQPFRDAVTVVESEWIAPSDCVIIDRMLCWSANEAWVKVRFLDGSEHVIRMAFPATLPTSG